MTTPPTLRQSMAWLHTWGGIAACWMLFAIFLTGTICVFEEPITRWMKPERSERLARVGTVDPARAVGLAQRDLERTAPRSDFWSIGLPNAFDPDVRIYWDEAGKRQGARLDPQSGARLPASADRSTEGGYHFITMHHELHAGTIGSWIVGFFVVGMLAALVSGVIVHKRIFKDIFTFRPGRGQRAWLDGHNVAGVLTLPFQAMIAYTGLTLAYSLYMPAAIAAHYPSADAYFADLLNEPPHGEETQIAAPVVALQRLVPVAEARLGQQVSLVYVEHPGDSSASAELYGPEPAELNRLAPARGSVHFAGVSGALLDVRLPEAPRGGAAQQVQDVLSALHMASFGGLAVKWLYFLCGLAGTAMIGSGAILFMVKRRRTSLHEFGAWTPRIYRLIDAVNVAAMAGLAIACIGYFWANRLIPVALEQRAAWEIRAFFAIWLATLAHAALRPARAAWIEQLAALALLCLALPLLGGAQSMLRGDWAGAGVEAVALIVAAVAGWSALRLKHAAR